MAKKARREEQVLRAAASSVAWLRAYYLRLRVNEPRSRIIAVMHKLLAAIFRVARRRQPFVISLAFPPAVSVTAGPR